MRFQEFWNDKRVGGMKKKKKKKEKKEEMLTIE